jgi:hypothetical protein
MTEPELERYFFRTAVLIYAGPSLRRGPSERMRLGGCLCSPRSASAPFMRPRTVSRRPWLGSSCIDYPSSRILEGASLMNATTQVVSVSPPIAKTMIVQSPRGQ